MTDTGWRVIGQSIEGRDIRLYRVGHGPRVVLWIDGIHGNEPEGAASTARLPAAFLADPSRAARVTLHLIEDLNPDGRAASTRFNAAGIDLNRNFSLAFAPAKRHGAAPLDQPEAALLAAQLRLLRPALVIAVHSWPERHFINHDGPAADLAARFSALSGYPAVPSDGLQPTPGSLGSWVGLGMGIPVLTLEHRRDSDPVDCWEKTGSAILAVIDG
jgi:protein MpaA